MNSAALREAMDFADGRGRLNVQVYRHNCLIAAGPRNSETGHVAWNVWSVTKSVSALVAGIASDDGKLDLNAPIGRYLPDGLGDAAHRDIRVSDLLTETSGLRQAVATEGITGIIPIDPNSPVQALGLPLINRPGSTFAYSQRTVDLLVFVTQRAIGEDFQRYAQRKLFGPLGIPRSDYHWSRDRSENTYGYAHLMLPPNDLAKLGLLLSNNGKWGATRVVSADFLRKATTPSPANPCYGFLLWLAGPGCGDPTSGLPAGAYATSGMLAQNTFVIPTLDLMVSWTGIGGSRSSRGVVGLFQSTAELGHNFFRQVFAAVRDTPVADTGPYVEPPDKALSVSDYVEPDILLAVFGIGPFAYPGCSAYSCLGIPLLPAGANQAPGCGIVFCLGDHPRTPGIR